MFTSKLVLVMHISIENLGVVKTAEIELSGITVLTGHNDSGKSFIGKLIYSIIATISKAKLYDESISYRDFLSTLSRVQQYHWRLSPRTTAELNTIHKVDALIADLTYYINENRFLDKIKIKTYLEQLSEAINLDIKTFDENRSRIKKEDISRLAEDISTQIGYLTYLADYTSTDEESYKLYFNTIIIPEIFGDQINTIGKSNILNIKIIEGSTVLVSIVIENNKVSSFNHNSRINPLFKNDSTLIDTPTILSLEDHFFDAVLQTQGTNIGAGNNPRLRDFPLHYSDFLIKTRTYSTYDESGPTDDSINDIIKNVINGEVLFDKESNGIIYKKSTGEKIASPNIATGIKSFGILQMLNKNGWLNPDTVLILDEPEVHLHPEWEIKYARLLFDLCKFGVLILISTHSSYFIQSIKTYASEMNLEEKVHYYFGEKQKSSSLATHSDVTSDLNPIFKALSKPMRDIYM